MEDRTLDFLYDALGNRIKKTQTFLTTASPQLITYYVRNSTGALIALYEDNGLGVVRKEIPLSIGTDKTEISITVALANDSTSTRNIGNKYYELKDHLGSVRTVITDIKNSNLDASNNPIEFSADVASISYYYSYGMQMPNRTYQSSNYKYGFQGKEKDDDLKGDGNSYDFGARLYDSRVGRWLSTDPLADKQPGWSPYKAFYNNPIYWTDPDGKMEDGGTDVSRNQTGGGLDPETGNKLIAYTTAEVFKSMFNNSLPQKFIDQYVHGKGKALDITETEMVEIRARPVDLNNVEKFSEEILDIALDQLDITGREFVEVSLNSFIVDNSAGMQGSLGKFKVRFDGTVTVYQDGSYAFDGTMQYIDMWDFDPKAEGKRTETGERETRFANATLPGEGFLIKSPKIKVYQDSKMDQIDWFEDKPIGTLFTKVIYEKDSSPELQEVGDVLSGRNDHKIEH